MNNIPALVQIMAGRRPGDKSLSEPMMVSLLMHICVTRLQWVEISTSWCSLIFMVFCEYFKYSKYPTFHCFEHYPHHVNVSHTRLCLHLCMTQHQASQVAIISGCPHCFHIYYSKKVDICAHLKEIWHLELTHWGLGKMLAILWLRILCSIHLHVPLIFI